MPLLAAFHTLGCKLNQLETDAIADAFARAGFELRALGEAGPEDPLADAGVEAEGPDAARAADLVVVNTCTVTGKAEQKARRIVRRALALNPRAVVVVTGCYAQVEADSVAALGDRVIALPGDAKARLLSLPGRLDPRGGPAGLLGEVRDGLAAADGAGGRFAYDPAAFAFHSRPALKVQDGCDGACAYCRVHIARGKSASLPAAEALSRARALEAAGRAEIVLAGVNLSQYRDGRLDFPGLLRTLLDGTEKVAFRVSSYEPDRVDPPFLEAFAHPRVRPHAHLALQSGSDPVLASMGRSYGRERALEAVRALRVAKGDPFIAADLISGFPGETQADAEATLELAEECRFAWIHAFRFSPRPGTRAASMPGRVPERIACARVDALLELGRRGKAAYINRWREREISAIFEGGLSATTDNYLKVELRGLPGSIVKGRALVCRIDQDIARRRIATDADACALYISDA